MLRCHRHWRLHSAFHCTGLCFMSDKSFRGSAGGLTSISIGCLLELFGECSLFLGFSENGSLDDITCSQSFQLGLSTLDFDILSQLFITNFGGSCSLNVSNVHLSVKSCFVLSKFCLCLRSLGISFGPNATISTFNLPNQDFNLLGNLSLSLDFSKLTLLLSNLLSLTDATNGLGTRNINTSLVNSTFVCLLGQ